MVMGFVSFLKLESFSYIVIHVLATWDKFISIKNSRIRLMFHMQIFHKSCQEMLKMFKLSELSSCYTFCQKCENKTNSKKGYLCGRIPFSLTDTAPCGCSPEPIDEHLFMCIEEKEKKDNSHSVRTMRLCFTHKSTVILKMTSVWSEEEMLKQYAICLDTNVLNMIGILQK